MDKLIIAIDGTAASGKSTIGSALAKSLSTPFFDSGSIYRIITARFLEQFSPEDPNKSVALLKNKKNIQLLTDTVPQIHDYHGKTTILIEGIDYTPLLHTVDVDNHVAVVSANKQIREFATEILKDLGHDSSIIMAGRDIGTTVFPDAHYKFYITADDTIRAHRRLTQQKGTYTEKELDEMKKTLIERDLLDMRRKHSPLIQHHDAILIDNSRKELDEVISQMLFLIQEK
jgi:cytidylate kinase